MSKFEFHIFDENAEPVACEIHSYRDSSSARSKGGQLSKKYGGPVDIAYCGKRTWDSRYLTTVMPSEFHVSGYRCEKLK